MKAALQIEVGVGWCSEKGRREANEDYVGVCLGTPAQRTGHGIVAAVADGVGSHPGGRVAAEAAVRGFMDVYLGRSETAGLARAAEAVNALGPRPRPHRPGAHGHRPARPCGVGMPPARLRRVQPPRATPGAVPKRHRQQPPS